MLNTILTKECSTFKELENKIFDLSMQFGREVLSQILKYYQKS